MSVITVQVPRTLNLEQLQKVVAGVVAKCGHPNCGSGYDIRFASAVDYAVDRASLEVRELDPQPSPW